MTCSPPYCGSPPSTGPVTSASSPALERVLTGVTEPDPELARDIAAFRERLRDG